MRKRVRWIVAILVILGAPVAWYLGSPLFINKTVDEPFPTTSGTPQEAFPMSKGGTVPNGMTQQQAEDMMVKASKVSATATDPKPGGSAGEVVARGSLTAADSFHRGEGTVAIYRVGQELVLRLDPFKVTNGPDLRVILTKLSFPKSGADVQQGYLEVAKLKANLGSQNYTLAGDARLDDYHAVVIYCKMFHVLFSIAPLQAPQ
jgi:hypothetical protein